MHTGSVRSSLAVVAAVSVLGLAACGGGSGSGTTTGVVPPGARTTAPTTSAAAGERKLTKAEARREKRREARAKAARRTRDRAERARQKRAEAKAAKAEKARAKQAAIAASDTPQKVVAAYQAAFGRGDGAAVCRLYTKAQQRRIARSFGKTCAKGIAQAFDTGGRAAGFKQGLGSLKVGDTKVSGNRAVVQLVPVAGGDADPSLGVKLARTGRVWLITRPSGG
jgi:nucleoid-associated protein YgaU